jgi:phosphinothricin acetyltransferase
MATIRRAVEDDLPVITEIYNEAVLTTTATFDTEPKTVAERTDWFRAHGERHPLLVAEKEGQVVGWASLSAWSARRAYDDTAEVSLYVLASMRGQGIGGQLMAEILKAGQQAELHSVLARVTEENAASVRLHCQAGFKLVGVMREVGFKFGRRLDVNLMQLVYED